MTNEQFDRAKFLRSNISTTRGELDALRQYITRLSAYSDVQYSELKIMVGGYAASNASRSSSLQLDVLKAVEATFIAQIEAMEAEFAAL